MLALRTQKLRLGTSPPGPPGGVRVEEIRNKSVRLIWSRGADNHSPISKYTVQCRDWFSQEDWRDATTSPPDVEGNAETATVVDLFPWTEYEFRVIATNTLGTGDPSSPSPKVTTLEAVPVVAPSDIGGGGGTSKELTITWTVGLAKTPSLFLSLPVDRGHKLSFSPKSDLTAARSKPMISLCVTPVPSEAPTSVEARALSASEAIVWWLPVTQHTVEGYQVRYWRKVEDREASSQRVVVSSRENQTRLENMRPNSPYLIEVRAYNAAGYGPPSHHFQIYTKKAPPSRPPKIISKKLKGTSVNIAWEHVEPLANESTIDGYKVLYRKAGLSTGILYTTGKRSIDLPMPRDGDCVVEVRAHSEGGDGAVAQVRISGGAVMVTQSLSLASLLLVAMFCLLAL
ncbi:contactin-1a-like [Salvelinus sp. IW2-2015]|uniref:contactin-1a-like n=1 Tax=Salvelinus sp. IW2-2015 TaxID=2691554 RepID=UPI000CEB0DB0|nr:contactin-1a-like [Salvelinus alpinus]